MARFTDLTEDECLERLRTRGFVGRLAFISDGRPVILPVNYVVEEGSIVFCTEAGSKLSALRAGAEVAFEVDETRPLYHSGWSVMVSGRAAEVTDERDLERLRHGPLRSWAAGSSAHWVRILIDGISGREIPEE